MSSHEPSQTDRHSGQVVDPDEGCGAAANTMRTRNDDDDDDDDDDWNGETPPRQKTTTDFR